VCDIALILGSAYGGLACIFAALMVSGWTVKILSSFLELESEHFDFRSTLIPLFAPVVVQREADIN
jgi:hypothetical protein